MDRIVSSFDRSGIINQQGAGDIAGAAISEKRRSADLVGGTVESVGTTLGALSMLLPPPFNLIGGVGLPLLSKIPGWIMNADANKDATRDAYSQNWERQAPAAMELAGLLGRYGRGETQKEIEENNTSAIRAVFSNAARAANAYGYSAGEGMEAVKQGARQGLGEGEALAAAKTAFAFERGTGADRNTLLELETRGRRFGMDNMIGAAWRGNQASGMSTGQFNEFLRSMQRVFEDGISKGFARGANEIAGNFVYLARLSGGNELYKGEEGASVMRSLSSGIEGATSLSSVNDILMYQAAGNVIDRWKNAPKDSKEYKNFLKLGDLDGNLDNGYEIDMTKLTQWEQRSVLMDKGLTPEVLDEVIRVFRVADMGDPESLTGRLKDAFGMNATRAIYLGQNADQRGEKALADYRKAGMTQSLGPPASGSAELRHAGMTESFSTFMAEIGQRAFNVKVTNLQELFERQEAEAIKLTVQMEE
jgi:hypothetical protein